MLGIEVAEVHRLANGRRTVDRPAAPIPVILGYFTRFPDDNGMPRQYDDIYGLGVAAGAGPAPSGGDGVQPPQAPACAPVMPIE